MAQSGQTNLAVGIVVDSNKAKADLLVVNAEIAKTAKAIRELTRAGDTAAVNAQKVAAHGLFVEQSRLHGVIKAGTAATKEQTKAHKESSETLKELTKYMIEFAKEAGVANLSVRGLKLGLAGLVISETIKTVIEAVQSINELRNAAHEAATDPASLQGLRNMFRAVGVEAKEADALYGKFTKTLRESRLRQIEVSKAFTEAGKVPGATHADQVEALNKAQEEAARTDPFATLNINSSRYAQTVKGSNQALQDASKELLRLKEAGRLDEAAAAAEKLGFNLEKDEKVIKQIADSGVSQAVVPTDQDLAQVDKLNEKYAKTADLVRQIQQGIGLSTANLLAPGTAAGAADESLQPASGFASGGHIRGAGSGTSDSILARLSNGEYVINANSTRRLGTGYLNALNSFADGGLVGAPPMRFAAGGLAAAGGGTPAHLHLGGHVFATTASSSVASALVSEAHRQAISSAGVKPSWFAARPGG